MSVFNVRKDATTCLKRFTGNVKQTVPGVPDEPFVMVDYKVNLDRARVSAFIASVIDKGEEKLLTKDKLKSALSSTLCYGGTTAIDGLKTSEASEMRVDAVFPELSLDGATLTIPQGAICVSSRDLIDALCHEIVLARSVGQPDPVYTNALGLKQAIRLVLERHGISGLSGWRVGVDGDLCVQIENHAKMVLGNNIPAMFEGTTPKVTTDSSESSDAEVPEDIAAITDIRALKKMLTSKGLDIPAKSSKSKDEYVAELQALLA